MNHLIMGEHQHKILAVSIDHAEGQLIVVMGPEIGIIADIGKEIIHKAHIPFQVKTKTVLFHLAGDLRPCSGLLGNHQNPRITLFHHGI